MKIGVPKEVFPGETRTALVPPSIAKLRKKEHQVVIETGAGLAAGITDEQYEKAGAVVVGDAGEVYTTADIIIKVQPPQEHPSGDHEARMLKEGGAYIGYLAPFTHIDVIRTLAERGITSFSMEFVPRITRAQSMDSLSSMATLAGYKAVIIAAARATRMFPMLTTAAGSIAPATVIVLGAGVAGLQAIATAKRLGGRVEAFDPRAAVKEQIESVGGTFIAMEIDESIEAAGGYAKEQSEDFLRREQETIAARLPKADAVITTAQIFGKKPPVLITEEMVKLMPRGSVIVDLAAESGGNCELTRPDEVVQKYGVTIYGVTNLAATLPANASQMYSNNVTNLFLHLYADADKGLNFEDEITRGACMTAGGEIQNEMIRNSAGGTSS